MTPVHQVGASVCARHLKPGQVKRHPVNARGSLYGYFVACPACGFVALWDDEPGFVETAGQLDSTRNVVACLSCKQPISITARHFD